MAKIDATSVEDVKLLATCFLTSPKNARWKIVAKTYDLGLMGFKGFVGVCVYLLNKIGGKPSVFQFLKILSEKYPTAIDNCIEDTIRHIVNGKDTSDPASVGGWSQEEIDLLLGNVTFSLLKDRS